MKNKYLPIIILVCVILFLAILNSDRGRLVQVNSGNRLVMGTVSQVTVVNKNEAKARKSISEVFALFEEVERLMSNYRRDSQINLVNRKAFEQSIKLNEMTFEVLQQAQKFSQLTDGAFDITVGPLIDLWRRAGDVNFVPGKPEIENVYAKIGYDKVILDANQMTVKFLADGMRLDLGGIAKGYAIDKAIEILRESGASGGFVDIGGDIRCFGRPKGRDHWRIGLQDPDKLQILDNENQSLMVLKLNDAAVATSGDYRRFIKIGDKNYSHIIDANTGLASNQLKSVTIICEKAIDADALATAVSVMGIKKGIELIESLENTEAILISNEPDYRLIQTSRAKEYLFSE